MGLAGILLAINNSIGLESNGMTKYLSTLDNLGIDTRLWYIFEQSNFKVEALIFEMGRIGKIYFDFNEQYFLSALTVIFSKIKVAVVVNGNNEKTGSRYVKNQIENSSFDIVFHSIKLKNINVLKLSAICAQGNFYHGYKTCISLFVKAVVDLKKNPRIVRLVKTDKFLHPSCELIALKMGYHNVSYFMKNIPSCCSILQMENAFNWLLTLEFEISDECITFSKKTREVMGNLILNRPLLLKFKTDGIYEVEIKFNFQFSDQDYKKSRQIKLKSGRERTWMGGNKKLSLYELIYTYLNLVTGKWKVENKEDCNNSFLFNNRIVTSCVNLSGRGNTGRKIEIKRLIREWIVYSVIRRMYCDNESNFTGISGIRTLQSTKIHKTVVKILSNLDLPTNKIKIFEHLQNLESLGILNYRGSRLGFTITDFQFSFDNVDILEHYKQSIIKLYSLIRERSPSNFPSYFRIYEEALTKLKVLKGPLKHNSTKELEIIFAHDKNGFVVKRLKQMKKQNILPGNKNVIDQLLKVIYHDLNQSNHRINTITNIKLKEIWEKMRGKYSLVHEHKKHAKKLFTQADALVYLINEIKREEFKISAYFKDIQITKNDSGPFREFAANSPNLGYDLRSTIQSPRSFSGHGKGISSIKNIYFSVILDLACLILDHPDKMRMFYWSQIDRMKNITRLYMLVFSGEEFATKVNGKLTNLIDQKDRSLSTIMKLFRLLTKKTRYYLKPKQRIISGKIDSRVIHTIENRVLNTDNFKELYVSLEEEDILELLNYYRKKWNLLCHYLEIKSSVKTYNDLLNDLITLLYDLYYKCLNRPDIY